MKRITFLLAAALAIALASGAGAEVKCSGTPCIDSAGGVTSPISVDPMSATGVWTFDNAADTPVTLSDGAAGGTICSVGVADTANSVCVGSSAITGEGSSADASETILAFGNATADQTLTCTGAASSLGCVVDSPAVPVNGATAGNSLALTASPAIPNAGAGTDGAAAGGSITLTAGAAARDTSGNANGGGIILTPGAGIGTGVSGSVVVGGAGLTVGTAANNGRIFMDGSGSADTYIIGDQAAAMTISTSTSGATPRAVLHSFSVETVASTKAPASIESMEIYTNGADSDGQAITLPNDPTVGVCYDFALTTTNSSGAFVIAPSAGETLSDAGTSCATVFSATAAGATCRICAVSGGSGGAWFVMSKNGTWTCTP